MSSISSPASTPDTRAAPRPWQRVLLVAGLIWALAVVAPDFYRLSRPLASLGFMADNSGVIYSLDEPQVATSTGAPFQLHKDDRIVLQPGACRELTSQSCRDYLAVFGGMGGLTYVLPGTVTTLTVQPAASARPVEVTVTARTQDYDMETVAALVVLGLCEVAAVIVLWMAFKLAWDTPSCMNVGFFLFAMWFNPGQYFVMYAWLQHAHPVAVLVQEALQAIAQGAGYAGFLIFALRFPHDRRAHRLRRMESVAILLGVVLALLQLASFLPVFGVPTETITRCAIFGGYAVAILALVVVLLRLRYQSPLDYQRMRWVLWGCLIGLPAFILADSHEATSLWSRYVWEGVGWEPAEWVIELGFLLSGLLTIFICAAVRHRRIVSVTPELRALLATIVVLIVGVMIEQSLHDPIHHALQNFGVPDSFHFYLAIVPLVICSGVVHRGAHTIDHLFNRGFYRAKTALDVAAESAAQAQDEETVDRLVMETPMLALDLASAAVFREAHGVFRRVLSSAEWGKDLLNLAAPVHLANIDRLRKGETVGFATPRDADPSDDAAAPALGVPVKFEEQLYAVAAYGTHRSGAALDHLELELLCTFAARAAVGYERLELRRLRAQAGRR